MTTKTNNEIENFLEVKVSIKGQRDCLENSANSRVNDLFISHLKETFNDSDNLKQYGIDVFKVKIGDEFNIYPTKWTQWFCNDKNQPLSNDYDIKYKVVDIVMQYFTTDPDSSTKTPKLLTNIILEKI